MELGSFNTIKVDAARHIRPIRPIGPTGIPNVPIGAGVQFIADEGWSPTVALNLGSANTWTAAQTFSANTNFPGSGIWNSSGNVGIGTASPHGKLEVNSGNAVFAGTSDILMNGGIQITDGTGGVSAANGYFSIRLGNYATDLGKLYLDRAVSATGYNVATIDRVNGNVGIGTSTPAYKLQVAGVIYADEGTSAADIIANKIDASTLDPVYTIDGKRYATYVPSMPGVKEEMTGVVMLRTMINDQLSISEAVLDFKNASEGFRPLALRESHQS